MQSYKDLEIYKASHKLAVEIHKMSLDLPKLEMYEEGSQIRRSSKAIPANIVEGFGRKKYQQDYLRFLIRLRRIPRLFKPWMNAAKSRGATADSAEVTCRRITPTSVAKLSERISPYLTSRGKPGTTGFSPWGSMRQDQSLYPAVSKTDASIPFLQAKDLRFLA